MHVSSAAVSRRPAPRADVEASSRRALWLLAAIVACGAAVRLSTLGVQSYWRDETLTVVNLDQSFTGMLERVSRHELTPPLYYLLAWLWSQAFGLGEVALRSLTALFSVATIPVVYVIGRRLCSERVGLIASLLFAVNPFMFRYGQEARAYALLVLLTALSLAFFVRLVSAPSRRDLAGWAVCSALALLAHYFAAFLVGVELMWLLAVYRGRRDVLTACAAVAATGLALLPLSLVQAPGNSAKWLSDVPLSTWIAQVPKQFLVGLDGPTEAVTASVSLALVGVGVALLVARGDARERAAASLCAVLAAAAILIPLLLTLAGVHFFTGAHVMAAWVPAGVVVASGLGARRAGRIGLLATAGLVAVWLAVIVAVDANPRFQRENWRGGLRALGAPADRAIVVSPGTAPEPLEVYRPRAEPFDRSTVRVREIALVDIAFPEVGKALASPPVPRNPQLPGFRVVDRRRTDTYSLLRLRSVRPHRIPVAKLGGESLGDDGAAVLLERPPG